MRASSFAASNRMTTPIPQSLAESSVSGETAASDLCIESPSLRPQAANNSAMPAKVSTLSPMGHEKGLLGIPNILLPRARDERGHRSFLCRHSGDVNHHQGITNLGSPAECSTLLKS
jgi:hypothetical protein